MKKRFPYSMSPTNWWADIASRALFSVASGHNSSPHTKSPFWLPPTQGIYIHAQEPEAKEPPSVLPEKTQTNPPLRFSLKEAIRKHLPGYCCQSQLTKTWTKLWRPQQGLAGGMGGGGQALEWEEVIKDGLRSLHSGVWRELCLPQSRPFAPSCLASS